ncbi:probable terpene synthase 6 [Durio zibethinus]|uniref:(+)-delta-cadinene synthase n=1 Tax=Durio zibethinus TaxID=66656 RepID=A0A6P5ZGH0_DURZI|nr:probable terpene synthase 6 [Durio zibethinus]
MSYKEECDVFRPVAAFSKNIWRDKFPSFSSMDDSVFVSLTKEIDTLKEKVKDMLMASTADPIQNVKLVDTLLRLGVSYHFENDIENQLERIFDSQRNLVAGNDHDLNSTSIVFRVFRQYGFKMSCGVFDKFKDNDGKFRETLIDDVRGMLSLYEAAYLRVHEESILEEALAFTKANLKSLATKPSPHLAKQITFALDQPLNKCPPRLEARTYISFYEEEETRNETLLKFAKLDFNRVQVLHKQEISHIARFWEEYNFSSELSYARERYVEAYTWMNVLKFEPHYSRWRVLLTKTMILISILDDTFDAYGTAKELQWLTDALKRWEIGALDELQDYTKVICKAVLDVFNEIDEQAKKEGRSFSVPSAQDAFIGLINNYQAEAKWSKDSHVPTFEEYMRVAMKTSTFDPLITIAFIGMGTIARLEAFEWLESEPRIIKAINIIGRIMDDIASHEFEQLREHIPSSVECYMKQQNLSEKDALEDLEKQLEDAWKDINEERMRPTTIPRDLLSLPLNLAQASYLCYKHGDGYTHPDPYMKDNICLLFVDPIPI